MSLTLEARLSVDATARRGIFAAAAAELGRVPSKADVGNAMRWWLDELALPIVRRPLRAGPLRADP